MKQTSERGPSGLGDDNSGTEGDPTWTPLNSPASNESGADFTPPFPTYPSGHATFGAAAFRMIGNYYGTDDIAFTITSDELNGITTDTDGNVRPHAPRSFSSLSEAAEENGVSRVYLGIHWNFDASSGIDIGNGIADYAFANFLQPASLPDPCENDDCITIESYDLSPIVSVPVSVQRDSSFATTFSVQNNGPGNATGATLTIELPQLLEINSVLPGNCSVQSGSLLCTNIEIDADDTEQIPVEFTVPPQSACPTTVVFTPTVIDQNGGDYDSENNVGESVELQIECEPENDIAVQLNGAYEQELGTNIEYTVTVTNNGPSSAANPVVSLTLPSGVTFNESISTDTCMQNGSTIDCTLAPLTDEEVTEVTIVFTPLATLACGTEISTQATAQSSEKELNNADNTSGEFTTELTCTQQNSGNSSAGGSTVSVGESNRDTVGHSQSPGSTRGKGTTEATVVLSILTRRNGMGNDIGNGGHYRLANNASTLTKPIFVASAATVITDGYSQSERNVICSMKRYMEEQDPRNRKTPEFKDWLIGMIAQNLHFNKEQIQSAITSKEFCVAYQAI